MRNYVSADRCFVKPCVVTQHGAIRFQKGLQGSRRIEFSALHRGILKRINLFQESMSFEQKFSARVLNRRPNRAVINLEGMVQEGKEDVIYLYGVLLQQDLDEGDLIDLKLISPTGKFEEYFFRYHHDGIQWDVDIAFVQPLGIFHPNPGGVIQTAYSTAALTFSVYNNMDPDRHSIPLEILHAARLHFIFGFLARSDATPFGSTGDLITTVHSDGFGGAGLTFFDFLEVGYAANFIRSPHTSFPYLGLEIRHLLEFVRSFKSDTHTRWKHYLQQETDRPVQ